MAARGRNRGRVIKRMRPPAAQPAVVRPGPCGREKPR